MSERYSRVFSLPENLYAHGSPVVIGAGALLKDNLTGAILGQLKLRNVSPGRIRAVSVCLELFDTAGSALGEAVEYDYLDLDVARDTEFGQKIPIRVPHAKARSFRASVKEVIFEDHSVWRENGEPWECLSGPVRLHFQDAELLTQYKIKFGSSSTYEPQQIKDLWYCTCGALNRQEEVCHKCRKSLFELQRLDMEELNAEKEARLEEQARRIAAEKALAVAKKKRIRRRVTLFGSLTVMLVAGYLLVTKVVIPTTMYNKAVSLMESGSYEQAVEAFREMEDYRDSGLLMQDCQEKLRESIYTQAAQLLQEQRFDEATAMFESLGDYRDSAHQAEYAQTEKIRVRNEELYNQAKMLLSKGKKGSAAIAFAKLEDYRDARAMSLQIWDEIAVRETISAGCWHTVGLKNDGTAVAVGGNEDPNGKSIAAKNGQCNVKDWKDLIAISAGGYHTVGLKADGTVVATGYNGDRQCNVGDWADIVAVAAGECHTVALKMDGTVVATGSNDYKECSVESWTDIVAIAAGRNATIGLKADGSVVSVGMCGALNWKNITAISAGWGYQLGLKTDGTVIAGGAAIDDGRKNVSDWTDIVAVSGRSMHTLGLKSDGTVVAVGLQEDGQCNTRYWKDIVAISTNGRHSVGLRSNGTAVAAGSNISGRCNVGGWTNLKVPN